MSRLLEGRVAIVTGAGRGIGRAHALELARHGAKVVVNDYGVSLAGEDTGESPAHAGRRRDRGDGRRGGRQRRRRRGLRAAAAMVQQAIDTFGGLDILVNNAGFVRDRMLVNTSEEEWDSVIRVHLKGHFAPLRHAGAYWRAEAKEGRQRVARVINTSSGAGLQGSIGQATYSAAKAGIAALTLVAAAETGSLRGDGQRDRAGGQDPDDRGRVRHLRRWRCPRTTRRSWPGWPRRRPVTSPAG